MQTQAPKRRRLKLDIATNDEGHPPLWQWFRMIQSGHGAQQHPEVQWTRQSLGERWLMSRGPRGRRLGVIKAHQNGGFWRSTYISRGMREWSEDHDTVTEAQAALIDFVENCPLDPAEVDHLDGFLRQAGIDALGDLKSRNPGPDELQDAVLHASTALNDLTRTLERYLRCRLNAGAAAWNVEQATKDLLPALATIGSTVGVTTSAAPVYRRARQVSYWGSALVDAFRAEGLILRSDPRELPAQLKHWRGQGPSLSGAAKFAFTAASLQGIS